MYNHPTKQSKATNQSDISDKKVYHTPKLMAFGSINELTKASSDFNANTDSGPFPNVYAS